MLRIMLILALALLAGCSSIPPPLKQGTLTPPAGQAYAIVSLTARAFEQDSASATLLVTDASGRVAASGRAHMATDTVFGQEGMSPAEGRLLLFTLPPGDYRLAQAWGYWREDRGTMWSGMMRSASFPLNAPFSLKEGEAVYLGEVFLDLSYRPEVTLRDARTRDTGHIQRVWKIQDIGALRMAPAVTQAVR